MLPQDLVDQRQPKPAAISLRAEERREQLRSHVLRDPTTRVSDRERGTSAIGGELDRDPAAGADGLHGILQYVHENLFHLVAIQGNRRDRGRRDPLTGDVPMLELRAKKEQQLFEQSLHIDWSLLRRRK